MTTVSQFLSQRDIDDFSAALNDWPSSGYGDDRSTLAVSPFTTFYFLYDPKKYLDASLLMVDIHEEFEALVGKPYKIGTHPDSERPHPRGSKRLPDLRAFAPKKPLNKNFLFKFSSETNHLSSPSFAGYFWRSSTWDKVNNNAYSQVQLYYGWQWWLDNQTAWRRFVLKTIDLLQAHQVYSGFAMANPLDIGARSEVAVWERSLAPRFYGLDIDYPFGMDDGLMAGIRPPTWGFLLSDAWREKLHLERADVAARLNHPGISIVELQSGQWIELGDKPGLYPVEQGLPELPARLNSLLKPIRNNDLGLVGFGQWDGDPNERFGRNDSRRWLARFDNDSDWPSPELRVKSTAPTQPDAETATAMRAPAGQPCPRTGWWFTPAQMHSRRHFSAGEVMPEVESNYGATIWQWDVQ